ncbi:MAG: acyltransferase domain-containing protein [Sphaerochaeta sp.]
MDSNAFGLGTNQLQASKDFLQSADLGSDHTQRVADLSASISERDSSNAATILDDTLQHFGALYPLLLILEVEDVVKSVYAEAGINETVRDATLKDVRLWVDQYASQHNGEIGLDRVFWISRHLCANILRLGRLQFEPNTFDYPFQLYQNILDGSQHMFANSGLFCDRDGYLTDNQHAVFPTTLIKDANHITGHLVDPRQGTIEKQTTQLPLEHLRLLVETQSQVLHLHIPSGSPLSPSSVEESLTLAKTYYPSIQSIACSSWLLDPALEFVTSQESNIRDFMHRFKKFPVVHEIPQIYERVFGFGFTEADALSFKATTSLQKTVQQAAKKGLQFHTTGGYLSC